MLKFYDNVGSRDEVTCSPGSALPTNVVWLDLVDATPEELRHVEQVTAVSLPSDETLTDLQTTGRLRFDGATLQVFTPVLFRDGADQLRVTTVGFFLTRAVLITIRTEELRSFSDYISRKSYPGDTRAISGTEVFVGWLEAIIDRMADAVEKLGTDLDKISRQIFAGPSDEEGAFKPIKYEAKLETLLRDIGRSGEITSNVRDSLLGVGRLIAFVTANAQDKLPGSVRNRIRILQQDIASLNDYETRLTDKVQFLLDSTLGFINIDQNRLFRLLTIASVIGIPPTFIVGLYGMNFKNIPEFDWAYGYQWGLTLIALSILIPGIWLRRKGWF